MQPVPNEALRNLAIPLLAGLSPSEKADVLAQARTVKVMPKTPVCTGGYEAEHLFVVVSGRVKYSRLAANGDEIVLRLFTPGETFGLATLLPDPPNYLGTAEAVLAGELLVWNHPRLLNCLIAIPKSRRTGCSLPFNSWAQYPIDTPTYSKARRIFVWHGL